MIDCIKTNFIDTKIIKKFNLLLDKDSEIQPIFEPLRKIFVHVLSFHIPVCYSWACVSWGHLLAPDPVATPADRPFCRPRDFPAVASNFLIAFRAVDSPRCRWSPPYRCPATNFSASPEKTGMTRLLSKIRKKGMQKRKKNEMILIITGALPKFLVVGAMGGIFEAAPLPTSANPRICSASAVFRNACNRSCPTCTSPWYMKRSKDSMSADATSFNMTMGCWHGLAWKWKKK